MCINAGDLLGGEASAPSAAAGSPGSMFAGLHVGASTNTSNQPPSNSNTPSVPQSPLDALAGLQGPSHLGIAQHPALWLVTQSSLGYVCAGSDTQRMKSLHHGQQDRHLTAQQCFVSPVHASFGHLAVHVAALLCCLFLCGHQFLVYQAPHSC